MLSAILFVALLAESHTVPFCKNGLIRLPNSFGEVKIEAWDRDEVSVDFRKRIEGPTSAKALRLLDEVDIRLQPASATELNILTEMPKRSFTRPLRGESRIRLTYVIHAPRSSRLQIRHGAGEVAVSRIEGEMEITASVGEIRIDLPASAGDYRVDARVHIGDIQSDYEGNSQSRKLVGQAFHGYDATIPDASHHLLLRNGIGDIQVHRVQ
jgi:Putative adhesin